MSDTGIDTDLGGEEPVLRGDPDEADSGDDMTEQEIHDAQNALADAVAAEAPDTDDEDEEPVPANQEAAKWRVRLREVEAERDGLQQRLQTLQAGEVERMAAAGSLHALEDPHDLWTDHALEDLLDADGNVDEQAVNAAVADTISRHPHWKTQQPRYAQGVRGRNDRAGTSWADILSNQR